MPLAAGERLGPYEVLGLVGAGGMGVVYRARDPRLRRDVAVKVITTEGAPSGERLRRFEDEARAVASLSHPNVLTVFDVGTRGDEPYVVFELLEGETLRERLRGGPLPLRSAVETGVQVCRGLQAAHARGILHRDLKPENLFLTSDGFVKILDFGLAKLTRGEGAEAGGAQTQTVAGVVMGTPGYLSPEQARGQEADARSDIFALGAILYEALSGRRAFSGATAADTISAILHEDPPPVRTGSGPLPGPVERVVRRCLAKEPADRFHSAHDLALALEAVLERPVAAAVAEEAEAGSPYPGLNAFTEADAGRFFGREGEVEGLWGRIRARRLLAVIGPSGAGKTSFVRAGVVASRPEGWAAIVSTPGTAPFRGLAQALAGELAGDAESVRALLRFDEPAVAFDLMRRWRSGHREALLVVDQLEELFTQCPSEAQAGFASFLGRLATEAGIHVLLSMRDDFLMRCHEHAALAPVFAELTPLGPLRGEALRRALEEPAKAEGFRFAENLVEEMTAAVEGERGALPLLAFAVSRLWEKRDRERKLLTREAYAAIGGVAGALARHAEATLERIGAERQGMVREIFRNLVTSHGTRAVAEREELLSLFPEREAAEEVLGALIDARLLTSYEVAAGPAGEAREETAARETSRHRIEIVHESLVKAWPRLVWWRAQDEEGAHLRDQLRQAAHVWEEKGRSPDVLWMGTAYREFELWRERYPGGLTALEEAFARAMTERERRRARLRRTAAASVVVGLAAVAIAIGISREQTARARDRAVAEARRAEAGKLIALGQLQLDTYPTAALAYARKSLERADTPEGRRLAMQALWRGPVARILPFQGGGSSVAFSPDGRWVAASTPPDGDVHLFGEDGTPGPVLASRRKGAYPNGLAFDARGDRLVTWAGSDVAAWSVPEGRALGVFDLGEGDHSVLPRAAPDGGLFTLTGRKDRSRVREWPHDGGPPTEPASIVVGPKAAFPTVDPTGTWVATRDLAAGDVELRRLRQLADGRPKRLGARLSPRSWAATSFAPCGDRLVTADKEGNIRLWSTAASGEEPLLVLKAQDPYYAAGPPQFDATGRRLSWASLALGVVYMWDLDGPPEADPLVLRAPLAGAGGLTGAAFHPGGAWVAEGGFGVNPVFWAVGLPYARVLHSPTGGIFMFAVSPDSRRLVGTGFGGLRLWTLQPTGRPERLALEGIWYLPLFDAGGRLYAVQWHGTGSPRTSAYLVPTDGTPPHLLTRFSSSRIDAMALDREGRRLAVATGAADPPETPLVRVLDLSTGAVRDFPVEAAPGAAPIRSLAFAADGTLVTGGEGGVQRCNTETGARRTILAAGLAVISASADGRRLVAVTFKGRDIGPVAETVVVDLDTGAHRTITTHRSRVAALDPSGKILVSGGEDGAVRVGPVTGEEPHLLFGHASRVGYVAVSPDGRWVVSVAGNEVRLWPMPDVSKPPFHTLPYGELMTKLGAMTNVQVVEDGSSPTGYKVDVGPFPGWRDMPAW